MWRSWRWRIGLRAEPRAGKISSKAADSLVLHCTRTPKVIRSVRDWSPSTYLVGFKLLSGVSPEVLIRAAEIAVAPIEPN